MKAKYYTTTKALESASAKKDCSTKPKVEFVKGDKKIDVMVGGKHFTSYLYEDELAKPILFSLRSPSGVMVNRGWPLMKMKGEEEKHPHHKGLWFAYRSVNDDDFWLDPASPAHIKHIKVTEMTEGAGKGKLSTVMHWVGKDGKVLLEEVRDMVFHTGTNEYAIDFSIDLKAQDTEVTFGDHKDGMFAIQAADWLREDGGSGRYFNSNGEQGANDVWGKRAQWVCLQGEKDGQVIGIAIFNHPSSVNYPAYWHTRGYGLFTANPLGQYVFEKGRGKENPQPFGLTLQPSETAHFGFRIIIYERARTTEQLQQRFKKFAE